MAAWWARLSSLNQGFYIGALFFSTLFVWQFIAALLGLGGGGHVDSAAHADAQHLGSDLHADAHADLAAHGGHGELHAETHVDTIHADGSGHLPSDHDAHAAEQGHLAQHEASGLATFRLLSIRSVLAFGTLFSWAGALYLQEALFPFLALIRAVLWGLAGMVVVALFFWALPRLTEEGTENLDTAVGQTGQVYINIPEDGVGQVKVLVSGTMSFVRARSRSNQLLAAGTPVRVTRRLDTTTIEVEPAEE